MNNPNNLIKNIAYLGPEIPSISATFIYNEILGIEDKGTKVFIYSVHVPKALAEEPDAKNIFSRTFYLYKTAKYKFLLTAFFQLLLNFKNFVGTLKLLLHDVISLKIFSPVSIKLIYHFLVGSFLAYKLEKDKIQHLHIHFADVPTQIGMYTSCFSGIPFTFTAHANDIFQSGLLLKEKADRAKCVITISEYNKQFLISKDIFPDKINIVRCGIKTNNFKDTKPYKPIPVIGSLGRLVEKKGMDILLTACMLLKNEGIKFKLEIAGDGPLLDFLKKLSEDLKIIDLVEFKGSLRHDLVFDWLRHLSVFALACKYDKNGDADGIPVVLMEAMANYIPVISTSITGVPELIKNEKSGLLSTPGDSEQMYHNIKRILTNDKLKDKLIREARKRIEDEFSQSINIDRIYRIISE